VKAVSDTAGSFIRRRDNVIDLEEYRRRLAQVDGSLALSREEEAPELHPKRRRRARPKARRRSLADWLDMAAGAATAAVAAGFWLWLML